MEDGSDDRIEDAELAAALRAKGRRVHGLALAVAVGLLALSFVFPL
jgi:hypothetical protein